MTSLRGTDDDVPIDRTIATWSAARLLLTLLFTIFCGEVAVMLLLPSFGPIGGVRQALLDGALLIALVFPALYLFVFIPVSAYIAERAREHKSLHEYDETLRTLSRELASSQEAERRRIAEELHDFLGQRLALCKLDLAELKGMLAGEKAAKAIERLGQGVDESLAHVRALTKRLSPLILYELGLEAAIKSLLEGLKGVNGTFVDASSTCALDGTLNEERGFVFYMAIREMALNSVRHARAGRLTVLFRRDEHTVRVEVSDDGCGFDASTATSGFGVFLAKERMRSLGGTIRIITAPGKGTSVVLTAPTERIYAAAARPQEG